MFLRGQPEVLFAVWKPVKDPGDENLPSLHVML